MANSDFDGLQVVYDSKEQDIECLTIFNPPGNVLTPTGREELLHAVDKADRDRTINGIVISGDGEHFSCGRDIREFLYPTCEPSIFDVCNRIAACKKPVIASIRGYACGHGLEIALAAHYRVATADSCLALPDICVGLVPAGAAVRASLLLGAGVAFDMLVSGRSIDAAEAVSMGLLDRVEPTGNAREIGLASLRETLRVSNSTYSAGRRHTKMPVSSDSEGEYRIDQSGSVALKWLREICCAVGSTPTEVALDLERRAYLDCAAQLEFRLMIRDLITSMRSATGGEQPFAVLPREVGIGAGVHGMEKDLLTQSNA